MAIDERDFDPVDIRLLRGVHEGLTNPQMSMAFGIKFGTVKGRMNRLMSRLGVNKRAQLAAMWQRHIDAERERERWMSRDR